MKVSSAELFPGILYDEMIHKASPVIPNYYIGRQEEQPWTQI